MNDVLVSTLVARVTGFGYYSRGLSPWRPLRWFPGPTADNNSDCRQHRSTSILISSVSSCSS